MNTHGTPDDSTRWLRKLQQQTTSQRGFTFVELLIGMGLSLVLAVATAFLMMTISSATAVYPRTVDEQQRLRAALDQIVGWLSAAGQGLHGSGINEGVLLTPALYPHRRGVSASDGDTSAFADRLTIVAGVDPPAGGRLAVSMPGPAAPIVVDAASCGPGRHACGIAVSDRVLVADDRAAGEWFTVSAVTAGIDHTPADLSTAYRLERGAGVQTVDVRALSYDPARHQLRVASPGIDLPLLDGVAEFSVRWFADTRPPRGPQPPPGESNCVIGASGGALLPALAPSDGPWVELTPESMSDGPWCGSAPWRFDADLFRVRLVRVSLRLDRAPTGRAAAASPAPSLEFDVAPRNLLRQP